MPSRIILEANEHKRRFLNKHMTTKDKISSPVRNVLMCLYDDYALLASASRRSLRIARFRYCEASNIGGLSFETMLHYRDSGLSSPANIVVDIKDGGEEIAICDKPIQVSKEGRDIKGVASAINKNVAVRFKTTTKWIACALGEAFGKSCRRVVATIDNTTIKSAEPLQKENIKSDADRFVQLDDNTVSVALDKRRIFSLLKDDVFEGAIIEFSISPIGKSAVIKISAEDAEGYAMI